MGVFGCCSWGGEGTGGEPIAGDFGGGVTVGFVGFLKNHELDLLSGGCGEDGGEVVRVEEEGTRGCETEGDCGEGVSCGGSIREEE